MSIKLVAGIAEYMYMCYLRFQNAQVIHDGINEFLLLASHLLANGSEILLENSNCQFCELKGKYENE